MQLFWFKAEAEVATLTRRIQLIETDLEQAESRFQEASTKSEGASKPTEESEKYNIPFNPIPPPNNSFTSLFENNRSFLDTLIIPVFLIK